MYDDFLDILSSANSGFDLVLNKRSFDIQVDNNLNEDNTIDKPKDSIEVKPLFNQDDEYELIKDYQLDPKPEKFEKLLDTFNGAFEKALYTMTKRKHNLPDEALRAKAYTYFDKSLKTYKPGTAKFTTWMNNQFMPLGRYIRDNTDIAHIPDSRSMHLARLREQQVFLEDKLGRPPSAVELADSMKWDVKQVKIALTEMKKDLLADEGLENLVSINNKDLVEDKIKSIMPDLTGEQQVILEYMFGMNGQPMLTTKQIAKKLKKPENKIRYEQQKIQKHWLKAFPNGIE